MKKVTEQRIDLAYTAAEFRAEFDALLSKYNAQLGIGWHTKWAVLQILFPNIDENEGVTLIKAAKGKGMRYVMEREELMGWPKPTAVRLFDNIRLALAELGTIKLRSTPYRNTQELHDSLADYLKELEG